MGVESHSVLILCIYKIEIIIRKRGPQMPDVLAKYKQFFDEVYSEGTIDVKTKHLIALGASLGAGCQP